jgi:tRNA pseudouridine38/39 synthase
MPSNHDPSLSDSAQAKPSQVDYTTYTPTDLIARITNLESQLRDQTTRLDALLSESRAKSTTSPPDRSRSRSRSRSRRLKAFNPHAYSTRHIALKFAYLGQRYNGYEHANGNVPPKPTIEEVLWKALRKTKLISPEMAEGADAGVGVVWGEQRAVVYKEGSSARGRADRWEERESEKEKKVRLDLGWEGCQYSKCGRTDKGVSAFGQVIGVRVRSNRPLEVKEEEETKENDDFEEVMTATTDLLDDGMPSIDADELDQDIYKKPFDPVRDELPYVAMLNSILPPDIRVLAWCPDPPADFDARRSCRERRYRYFFTNPAFLPTPGPEGLKFGNGKLAPQREGWLDIDKMREAAKKLEGLHDFRNLCKIDASKQMSGCERIITFADVVEVAETGQVFAREAVLNSSGDNSMVNSAVDASGISARGGPKIYTFCVHGSAFLWHQVRCMVGVLFLVGQGLEEPSIIDELLDIERNPGRPQYDMADDAPLVLWDCIFPKDDDHMVDSLNWIYVGDEAGLSALGTKGDGKFNSAGLVDDLWKKWREAKMQEILAGSLLDLAIGQGDGTPLQRGGSRGLPEQTLRTQRVYAGGDSARPVGKYIPVMQKPKMESLQALNAKYSVRSKNRSAAGLVEEGLDD